MSIWGSRSKKVRSLNSNGNDIERRNEASILASFSISKRNEPAYSRTCKDRSEANPAYSTLGSSDFPRSLCFMWFWFGLEIIRLVYKKAFFKILISFYLIWAFNFQTNSTVPFFEIGRVGFQKKRNFVLISKMCRNLALRSSQRFVLRKMIFCKTFQVPKMSIFL